MSLISAYPRSHEANPNQVSKLPIKGVRKNFGTSSRTSTRQLRDSRRNFGYNDAIGRREPQDFSEGNNPVADFVVDPNGMDRLSRTYAWGKGIAGSVGGLLSITTFGDDGVTPTATYIPIYDDRGNIVGLSDATDGHLVATYQYDPFGKLIGESGDRAVLDANPFGFQTMFTDRETGLVWFQPGGYYSPALQRRLSREPAGEGESANLYVMFHNDPINRVDPDGYADVFTLTPQPDDQAQVPNGTYDLSPDPYAVLMLRIKEKVNFQGRYKDPWTDRLPSAKVQVALHLGHEIDRQRNSLKLLEKWIGDHNAALARLQRLAYRGYDEERQVEDRQKRLQINLQQREATAIELSKLETTFVQLGLANVSIPVLWYQYADVFNESKSGSGLEAAVAAGRLVLSDGRGPGLGSEGHEVAAFSFLVAGWFAGAGNSVGGVAAGSRPTLVHLTNSEAAAAIDTSKTLVGATYAGPISNAGRSGWGLTLRTGLSPGSYEAAVPISDAAAAAFSKPIPIGPVTLWQRLTGAQFTAKGVLNLSTGSFVRTGVNGTQLGWYAVDVGFDALVAGYLSSQAFTLSHPEVQGR